jgi:hypothetical protein
MKNRYSQLPRPCAEYKTLLTGCEVVPVDPPKAVDFLVDIRPVDSGRLPEGERWSEKQKCELKNSFHHLNAMAAIVQAPAGVWTNVTAAPLV